jgi:hypothetical protein
VRHDADEPAACVAQVFDGADSLRQLHQREDPLLHAGAAGRRDRHERDAALGRALARPHQLLADDAPHRPAHEREVHDRELTGAVGDRGGPDHHGVAKACGQLRLDEPLRVRAQVEEDERILRAQVGRLLGEAAPVGELRDALPRLERKVVAAVRAHVQVARELVLAVMRVALRAGVRVRLLIPTGFRQIAMLDRDVDPLGHGDRLSLN